MNIVPSLLPGAKLACCGVVINRAKQRKSRRDDQRHRQGMTVGSLWPRARLLLNGAPEVELIVGTDTEPDPAVHPNIALVAASSEAVAPLDHADASFRPGAPFLPVAGAALPLLALALGALGRAIGNTDALDALMFRSRLVLGRVECSIRRH